MAIPHRPCSFDHHHFIIGLCIVIVLLLDCNSIIVSPLVLVGLRKQHRNNGYPLIGQGNQSSACSSALFTGTWVLDDDHNTLYQHSTCPLIDAQFDCQMYGRPDTNYLKYRWQPDAASNCQIPKFNGSEFLMRMRGKRVMFVGDSLGRNQWESLICMISSVLPLPESVQFVKGDPLSTFKFPEYELTVSFYRAPYLVDIDSVEGKRVLRLGEIRENANAWLQVDILYVNTGHWWTHTGSLQGWDYMEADGNMYQDMDRLKAMEKALRTWAKWVDTNIDISKSRVFFQGISPTHYKGSEWNAGSGVTASKNCYGETMPMTGIMSAGYPATYLDDQMKVLKDVLTSMKKPPFLLDITLLSAMRKDAHPSIYSGDLTVGQHANPENFADCSHWCLPGLPDTWNQLFYAALFSH